MSRRVAAADSPSATGRVYVTAKTYAHALSRDERDAAEIWDARMRQAMSTPKEERKKFA